MQDIVDWLSKLGLEQYAQRFVENGIDISVPHHLTDQHLKELDVLLGHRVEMLAAIAELSMVPTAATPPTAEPRVQDAAERRQLTVMLFHLR
jgi:hypothetical protein